MSLLIISSLSLAGPSVQIIFVFLMLSLLTVMCLFDTYDTRIATPLPHCL